MEQGSTGRRVEQDIKQGKSMLYNKDNLRFLILGLTAALTFLVLPPSTFLAAILFTMFFLTLAASMAGEACADDRGKRVLRELCLKAKLPIPELRTTESLEIFASARGVRPKKRRIVVSKGTLLLPEEELRAVVAHELGHYKAWDILDAVIWLPAVIAMFHGSKPAAGWVHDLVVNFSSGPLPQNLAAGVYVLPGFLLVLAVLATNRWSEEKADKFAVSLTKDIKALTKVLTDLPVPKRRFPEVLSPHPRVESRVKNIKELSAL